MSWVDCKTCGQLRKVEAVICPTDDGTEWIYKNTQCFNCGAPEWDQPVGADPYDDQPVSPAPTPVE